MRHLVYLVGPITGTSFAECTDWRLDFAKSLEGTEIQCLDPMRGKLYLSHETSIADSYDKKVMSTSKAIFARDRFDCFRADLIVANFLDAKKASVGSVMEIAWANSQGTPIVAIMEPGNPHDHAMLREACGWIVGSIKEAELIVQNIFTDGINL
jgi:hypothetical protein